LKVEREDVVLCHHSSCRRRTKATVTYDYDYDQDAAKHWNMHDN